MKKNLIKLSAGFLLSIFILPCTALSKESDFSFAEQDDDFFSLTYQAEEKESRENVEDEELQTLVAKKKKKNKNDDSSTNEESQLSSDGESEDSLIEEKKDENSKSKDKKQKSEVKKVEASRTITLNKNQELEVIYPGQGWIYLGEMDNTNLLRYAGRSLGLENTVFNLRTRNEGKTLLHFYKNDVLASSYIDDYLEVIVTADASSGEKITAPAYEEIIPASPSIYANKDKPSKEEKFVEITNEALTISSFIPKKEEPSVEETASGEEATAETAGADSEKTDGQTEAIAVQEAADVKEEDAAGEEKTSPAVTEEANGQNQNALNTNDLPPASNNTKKEEISKAESSLNQSDENQNASEQIAAENPSQENQNEEESAGESLAVQEEIPQQPLQGSLDAIMGASSTIVEDELETESPDQLLKDAESAYKKKEYDKALSYLREFFNKATSDFDKALYLQGQCYEANSSLRDIQAALDSYQALVKNYPSSEKWQDANNRIFYINRFYFGHF